MDGRTIADILRGAPEGLREEIVGNEASIIGLEMIVLERRTIANLIPLVVRLRGLKNPEFAVGGFEAWLTMFEVNARSAVEKAMVDAAIVDLHGEEIPHDEPEQRDL